MSTSNTSVQSSSSRTSSDDYPNLAQQVEVLKKDVAKLASAAGIVARHQIDPIEQYVEREPMKSVAIAVGIGCLLGILFSRR
ncbi:MAG: hypothetical protein AB7N71_13085 [Phycisphaerae bacterium]